MRAAAVGFRATSASADKMIEWGRATNAVTGPKVWQRADFVRNALFQAGVVDRDAAAIRGIEAVDAAVHQIEPVAGKAFSPEQQAALRRANPGARLIAGFVEGYAAFREGRHEDAVAAWRKFVDRSPSPAVPLLFAGEATSHHAALPYLALSLARLKRPDDIRELAERARSNPATASGPQLPNHPFRVPDYELAVLDAIGRATSGDHDAGLRAARAALGRLPEPGTRMIPPEYVLAEVLETLADATGQQSYLALALEFARGLQRYEPFAAWAYAFEAKHGAPGARRVRAAALALRLDARSARLQSVDAQTLAEARAWLKTHAPTVKSTPARRGESST